MNEESVEMDAESVKNFENRIGRVISNIRKRRNRACYQSILQFLNRNEPQLEMEQLKVIILGMETQNAVINKGKRNTESFYITQNLYDSTDDSEIIENIDDDLMGLNLIDEKFYEVIINNIKAEVKNVLNSDVINVNGTEINSCDIPVNIIKNRQSSNDLLYKSLQEEICFLRKEIESKDLIIKLIIEDRQHGKDNEKNNTSKLYNNEQKKLNPTNDLNLYNNVNNNNSVTNSQTVECRKLDNTMNKDSTNEGDFTLVNSQKRGNKRQITVLGDSILKSIESYKMQRCLKQNEKIYVKSFKGAVTSDFTHYVRPSQKYSPDMYVMHVGSNDLQSIKTPEEISDEIMELAKDIKTEENDIIISGITIRQDQYNEKGFQVNEQLKVKCSKFSFGFVDNTNITIRNLNGSGLHLNYSGTVLLANNLLKAINV